VTFSLSEHGVRGVVLDIEGTTTPMAFVHDVLFPYARAHLRDFLDADVAARMASLMDHDSKSPELKELQGKIWARGYADGTLRGEVFADVPPALERWHAAGIDLAIYSSGSVQAQQLLFGNTKSGDLTPHFAHFFDTAVGAKRSRDSYARIADAMHHTPKMLLFVSDVAEELDAARGAGFHVLLCVRPGNGPQSTNGRDVIHDFTGITA
jgi:enolase-phosphatase E1